MRGLAGGGWSEEMSALARAMSCVCRAVQVRTGTYTPYDPSCVPNRVANHGRDLLRPRLDQFRQNFGVRVFPPVLQN